MISLFLNLILKTEKFSHVKISHQTELVTVQFKNPDKIFILPKNWLRFKKSYFTLFYSY